MYLFFDTETTGLPRRYNAPATDFNNWPRLIQIAWMLYDGAGNEMQSADYIIKPEGFLIPKEAENIHGISNEKANAEGIFLKQALSEFLAAMKKSEILVAHNMSFDEKIVEAEFLRENMEHNMGNLKKICTKINSTEFCQLPGNYGFKWPSLTELHNKLFSSDFDGAHNALSDVKICVKCFFELKRLGVV
ncbi:MAG: 3'-5' exonuclease [bacterium]